MKILFAAAEADPFSKVGGLADVAAALPAQLKAHGHDVRVVIPCHGSAVDEFNKAHTRRKLAVPHGGSFAEAEVATVAGAGSVPVDLVKFEPYFPRDEVYGEPDDLLRYQAFCRAVAAILVDEAWTPDVLHLNDWHTAPLTYALRNLAWSHPRLRGVASLFTIHNLRYRGPDELNDYLAPAIYYADVVTTVSPRYAQEIQTPEFGEGLDTLLRMRSKSLFGIVNGVSSEAFNPHSDPALATGFDVATIEKREANRRALWAETGLEPNGGPVAAMVTRLTEQKGIDLVLGAAGELLDLGLSLVVLGQGDPHTREALKELQERAPGRVSITDRFDEGLARRIYGGADLFLMPSRYEPCGLGQLIAMRYGCVPVGRRTGGLADTILDRDDHPATGTGFLFDEFTPFALAAAVERALRVFRNPGEWTALQLAGMARDHSWAASAQHYVGAYHVALQARGIIHPE